MDSSLNHLSNSADPTEDPRLFEAVQEYLGECEAGRRPSRRQFLARYPEFAGELAKCLDGLELVRGAFAPSRSHPKSPAPSAMPNPSAYALGDFQIIREIGRGGMGVVYEAVQLSLGRRVALKVLPFAAALDANHLQRFKTEAQAAAQLHHSNIVPVYGVGCERGVHYYAMQLIEGRSLDVILNQMRLKYGVPSAEGAPTATRTGSSAPIDLAALSDGPIESSSSKMPPTSDLLAQQTAISEAMTTQRETSRNDYYRTAARLMMQSAEALEHAHSFGIIHRDIKPANLIVDPRGNLWVTDFGLAHIQSENNLTRTGDIVGTFRYMSPEQASGDRVLLDHRCDIYSLGASFYEWLTLQPPHAGKNRVQLLHQILNNEPKSPRSFDKSVPIELETIVLKAMSKAPADRYVRAKELSADLKRFLEDKPILARRPSVIDLARKWGRRHPGALWAIFGFLVFTILGLGATTYKISLERTKTEDARLREQQRAEEAEKRFLTSRRIVDTFIQIGDEELPDRMPFLTVRRRLLETALQYYQEFVEQRADNPEMQEQMKLVEDRIRQILEQLTDLRSADLIALVESPEVHENLSATSQQREQLKQVVKEWNAKRKILVDGVRADDAQRLKLVALTKEMNRRVDAILNADQSKRLKQIALQVLGSSALREPYVVEQLRLTDKQRESIRLIEKTSMDQFFSHNGPFMRHGNGGPGGPPPSGPGGKDGPASKEGPGGRGNRPPGGPRGGDHRDFERQMKQSLETMLQVLTDEQRAIWQEMIGKPFEFTAMPFEKR